MTKPSINNKKAQINDLIRLVNREADAHQFLDEELLKRQLPLDKLNKVRLAITQSTLFLDNAVFRFVLWVFRPINNFLDTAFKIIFFLLAVFFFLQIGTLERQANAALKDLVRESQQSLQAQRLQDIGQSIKEKLFLQKKEQTPSPEKREKLEKALHWSQYEEDSTVEDIWAATPKDLSKIKDLQVIYGRVAENYTHPHNLFQSIPREKETYINSLISAGLLLLAVVFLQSLLSTLTRNTIRSTLLKHKLSRIL